MTEKTSAPKNTVTPPRAEQSAQTTVVEADVVLVTTAFDVRKPELIDEAETLFKAQVAETYGKGELRNITLVKINHHIGTSARYKFTAELAGWYPMRIDHRMNITVNLDTGEIYGAINDSEVQGNMDELAEAALHMQTALAPVDTGKLVSTLGIRKTEDGTGREIGSIDHDLDYPAIVETGHHTEAGTWVPPQPYIRPSLDAVRRRLNDA